MSNVKIVLNLQGIRKEILQSSEMGEILGEITDGIQSRCGVGYAKDVKKANSRYISSVYTESANAMRDCKKNNTLLKGLKG